MSRALDNARYANTVYVCVGNRILLSNDGRGGINTPFEALTPEIRKQAGVRRPLPLNGTSWDVYVMPEPIELLGMIRRNLALLALLLAATSGCRFCSCGSSTAPSRSGCSCSAMYSNTRTPTASSPSPGCAAMMRSAR